MKVRTHRKYRHETSVPLNITLPPLLHQKLTELVHNRGFAGPSDYFQARIRLDAGLLLQTEQVPNAR